MRPLVIVGCIITFGDEILLLQRQKDPYKGLWSLPGGKVEDSEHLDEAALRETMEETSIGCKFNRYLGVFSEVIKDNEEAHFMIHIVHLEAKHQNFNNSPEGPCKWFKLNDLPEDEICPSDYQTIQKMYLNPEGTYFNCIIEKVKNKYHLNRYEKIS